MSKTITICVTNDDIITGVPGKTKSCAIAKSINRILDGEKVLVSFEGINFPRLGVMIPLPEEAFNFIEMFDQSMIGFKIKPYTNSPSFTLEPVLLEYQKEPARLTKYGEILEPFNFSVDISDELYSSLFGIEDIGLDKSAACGCLSPSVQSPAVTTADSVVN